MTLDQYRLYFDFPDPTEEVSLETFRTIYRMNIKDKYDRLSEADKLTFWIAAKDKPMTVANDLKNGLMHAWVRLDYNGDRHEFARAFLVAVWYVRHGCDELFTAVDFDRVLEYIESNYPVSYGKWYAVYRYDPPKEVYDI